MTAWDPARLAAMKWSACVRDILELYADCRDWPTLDDHNERLAHLPLFNSSGTRLRFAAASKRRTRRKAPAIVDLSTTYDGQIAANGVVPMREQSAHDFFNAVSWAAFPKTKQRINELQMAALRKRIGEGAARVPNARSREEDLLTMLDEGGLILAGIPFVLGHALFEHLYTQTSNVRAFAVRTHADSKIRAYADTFVADKLGAGIESLDPKGDAGITVSPLDD